MVRRHAITNTEGRAPHVLVPPEVQFGWEPGGHCTQQVPLAYMTAFCYVSLEPTVQSLSAPATGPPRPLHIAEITEIMDKTVVFNESYIKKVGNYLSFFFRLSGRLAILKLSELRQGYDSIFDKK